MFEKFITPLTFEQFKHEHWPKKSFVSHGDLARLPALLSSQPLNSLTSLLSVYKGSTNFSRGSQSPSTITAPSGVSPYKLWQMGMTLYMGDVKSVIPNSDAFIKALEQELELPAGSVRLGVFASPKGEGAPCHYDAEDVFSVQLKGRKTFEIAPMEQIQQPVGQQYSPGQAAYPALYPQITDGFPQWDDADFERFDMRSGSVLFIPRGTWHRSNAAEDSLALSIVINPPVLVDKVLGQMRQLLLQSEQWRQPLMGSNISDLDQLLKELPSIVQQLDANTLAHPNNNSDQLFDSSNEQSRFLKKPDAKISRAKDNENDLILSKKNSGGHYEQMAVLTLNSALMQVANNINKSRRAITLAELLRKHSELKKDQVVGLVTILLQAEVLHHLDFPVLDRAQR